MGSKSADWPRLLHRRTIVSNIYSSARDFCAAAAWALILLAAYAPPVWGLEDSTPSDQPRVRVRDLGLIIGQLPTGPLNAITDVPGVKVGQVTLSRGEGPLRPGEGPVRTGVTVIVPREDVWRKKVPA